MAHQFSVVVTAVLQRDDRILLLQRAPHLDHAPGHWDPCSGRIESGETPTQAVVREAYEETGLTIEPLRVVDTFHFLRGEDQEECIGITFLCRADGGEVVLSDEHTAFAWVRRNELDNYGLNGDLLKVLKGLPLR